MTRVSVCSRVGENFGWAFGPARQWANISLKGLSQINSGARTVSKIIWLKYQFLLTVRAPGAICESPFKGLSQITPGPRAASKNGYFGHFRTVPVRLPSDSAGAGTILRTRTGAGVSKTLLPILPAFYSNR